MLQDNTAATSLALKFAYFTEHIIDVYNSMVRLPAYNMKMGRGVVLNNTVSL